MIEPRDLSRLWWAVARCRACGTLVLLKGYWYRSTCVCGARDLAALTSGMLSEAEAIARIRAGEFDAK